MTPLATRGRRAPSRVAVARAGYGFGRRRAARLSAWEPSVIPIFASSPVAWTAVVTSSAPFGGCGAGGRRRGRGFLAASSDGEPERTARGLVPEAAFGFAVFGVAFATGLPAAFGVARVGFAVFFGAAFGRAGAFVSPLPDTGAPSRRRAIRVGRVLGR